MPSAEITRLKKPLHRSNSLHSELSTNSTQSKKVVSFNRDVAIKRIPRGERSGSVKLIAVVRPNAPESSTNQQRLWINDELISSPTPPDQILKEAQSIIDNVNRIECSSNAGAEKAKSQNKFSSLFSRTLPKPSNRLGRSNSEVPITRSNRRVTNDVERTSRHRTPDTASREYGHYATPQKNHHWNGRTNNGSGSGDESESIGIDQWRGRIRKPAHPRAILRAQQEGSSGSDTRSTPPRDFTRASHSDADLSVSKQRSGLRQPLNSKSEQMSKYQYFSPPQAIQSSRGTLPEREKHSPEIVYAHVMSNGNSADRSKESFTRGLQYSTENHEEKANSKKNTYVDQDDSREYDSIYRSSSYRNNVSSVLLNSIEENNAPPRPFFYGDSLGGKYFNSSSLDSSSPEPTPTPTCLKLVQDIERRSYLHEPARLEYKMAEEFEDSDQEFPRPLTDKAVRSSRNSLNVSKPTSTLIRSSTSIGANYRSSNNEKLFNDRNVDIPPETKPAGGFISTLMRRNKKPKNPVAEPRLTHLPPKPTKKPNKFLSLFTTDKGTDKHKSDKAKVTTHVNGWKKSMDTVPTEREFIEIPDKWKSDGFYIQFNENTNHSKRNNGNRNAYNEYRTSEKLEENRIPEMYDMNKPMRSRNLGQYENAFPQSIPATWEPEDYRLNMAISNSQRPYNETSTLGRPGKQSTHYTARSKSLDRTRKNERRNGNDFLQDQRVDPDEFFEVRQRNKGMATTNNRVCQDEQVERIDSNNDRLGVEADLNLRYFGDSDIQNYTTMKSRDRNNENAQKSDSKEDYQRRGTSGHALLNGTPSSGSETAGGRLSSSSGSSRSVYLHAPAVAEIPGASIPRTRSREQISNSAAVKQYRRLARSASVLAPWRPHVYFVEQ